MHDPDPSSPTPIADLLRGARAVLGWSLMEAGHHAAVSVSTVITAEGRGVTSCAVRPGDLHKLRHAYEAAGIRFIEDPVTSRGIAFGAR